MELKVWVEGIQRIICGVTDQTTCQVINMLLMMLVSWWHLLSFQDVVFALAHGMCCVNRLAIAPIALKEFLYFQQLEKLEGLP